MILLVYWQIKRHTPPLDLEPELSMPHASNRETRMPWLPQERSGILEIPLGAKWET